MTCSRIVVNLVIIPTNNQLDLSFQIDGQLQTTCGTLPPILVSKNEKLPYSCWQTTARIVTFTPRPFSYRTLQIGALSPITSLTYSRTMLRDHHHSYCLIKLTMDFIELKLDFKIQSFPTYSAATIAEPTSSAGGSGRGAPK
jgi:hypothetical protein